MKNLVIIKFYLTAVKKMKQELSKKKYLYKRLKLEEIKNPQYFFEIWAESTLVKFIIRLFLNKESFIKLFDFRIISSLILRDLNSSKSNKSSILNTFLLLTLSICLYNLSNKTIIEKKYLNLVKIVSGHINYYKYKEKNLEETFNKKNISTFRHQSLSKNFSLKKKKQYSIIRTSLKKKLYINPAYNENFIENSKWWKLWIIKEILPSWKIPSNTIKKIENLLEKKNTNDLNFFFKFYINNILCQNYDWENKFNSIFFENSKKNIKLRSNKNEKIFEDTLFLQIFFHFCENLIFEIENPLKSEKFISKINLDNTNYTNKLIFSIPKYYKKKINSNQNYLLKRNIIQNFKFWGEADSVIAKSYILIKKKRLFFFNNYTEFYKWQLYKKHLFEDKFDVNEVNINKNKLDIKLFNLNSLYNKKNLRIDKSLSEISYQISKYILDKIKNSNKLINNSKIIDQNLKLEKKEKPKIKKNLNNKYVKQSISSTIYDILFFNKNQTNILKSNFILRPFFKDYLILWIKNLFIENKKYLTNIIFLKNKKTTNFSSNSFSNNLSIDELSISFSTIKKYKKKFRVTKNKKSKFFRHFIKSDNYRLNFLSKIKKNQKNLNYFVFLDYGYNILYKKKNNVKKLINYKSSKNSFYLLWFFIHKYISIVNYTKNIKDNISLLFQIKDFINLAIILDKLNLLIIKYNLFYAKNTDYNLNYKNWENSKLKKKLLINKIIYGKKKNKNNVLINNDLKKRIKIYNIFSKFSDKITKHYKIIYFNFYKNSIKFLNNLFLINKLFYYKKNINLRKITKILIDQNLLNWKKKGKKYFYSNNIKKNEYLHYNFNQYILIDGKNKNKKVFKFFIEKQKTLLFLSNKINFLTNKNLTIKWSNKLNKKNIYIFYKTFISIFQKNFNKISKLFSYSPKSINIREKKLKTNILLKQVNFNIYYQLNIRFYFDKILITNFLINYFNNNIICTQFFNSIIFSPIWQNEEICFNSIKIFNKILLNSQFFEADTLKLLNFLYYSNLSHTKNLKFYLKKNKNNNLTYKQLIKNIAIKKKKLSTNQLTFFYEKINKNSNIESKIYKTFLLKNLEKINYQKLIFLHKHKVNLNHLLNSLIQFNPIVYEKKNLKNFELHKNIYIKKNLKPKYNVHQTNSFENYLLSNFFTKIKNENKQIVNWTNKLLIIKSNSKVNLKNIILNNNINNININFEKNKNIFSPFLINSIKLIPQTKVHKIFKTSTFLGKLPLYKKYIPWFFTFKWWKYFKNIILNSVSELLLNINDQFNYILPTTLQNKKKKLEYLLKNLLFNLQTRIIGHSFKIWNLRLLKQITNKHNNQQIVWPCFFSNLVIKCKKQYIATISFILFSYFIFQKYFSTLLGSDYFELWKYFEIIQYLIDSSRGKSLDNLIHNNSIQFIKSENLLMHLLRNLKHYIKNAKFYLFTKKKINKLLINNKGLDLSRRERKLLVQSLISDKSIEQNRSIFTSNTNYRSFQFDNPNLKQYKLKSYLENLTENYQKNLINYPVHEFYLAENLVFLSSWQKTTSLHIPSQIKTLKSKKPVSLELRLFSSKGILLIGSLETGRSYLVKNLAANSFVPLIKISINKLLYNKPDIITESWMNILMESLRRLNLILELAKKLSPCIIWMPNIHELNVNRSTQNVESDPTFLLGIFLKYFQTGFSKKNNNKIVIIGSTHLPKKVDPALISPNRLDRLINIRMFNILQRQKKISILLHSKHSKYFYSKKKKSCINEFGSRTMGYNARDLAGLINEILLISIVQNQSIIQKKTIRLAFHRQALGSTYINNKTNFTPNFGILFYKVGKVIVQNLFIKNSSRTPLYFGNDLWKKKFYYLSKWYLEPSIFESTVKELTILPHILACLAGLAARDSWFILENKPDNLISLDKNAENDFYLACNILESLLTEFAWLEIFETKNTNKTNKINFHFKKKNPLYMIKKGLFSIINQNAENKLLNKSFNQIIPYKKELYELTSNITWAPKISRLNFIRTNLFNWISRPNEFNVTYNFDFSKKREKKDFNGSTKNSHFFKIIQHKTKEQLPYERILSRIRRRNVQELEFQLEDILLEDQFVILGFSQLFAEYQMESQVSSKPMLFIGGRFLWDPTGLLFQNHHFVFSRQNLFIDEEMLRRLYVTYGARREREKSRSSQKIKQFFLRRGYGRDSINNFSINWWNQLPFIEKNNVETFKRIEGIGVQLKRPQVFTPVYLYQRWLIENPLQNMTRFELLNNKEKWLKVNNLLFQDSFIYYTLLEIYQYLLNFFILHQVSLNEMTKILLSKKWLFQNEIEYFINIINKMN